MSTIETGGPAFPSEVWDSEGCPQHTQGMNLRDYFAAVAMNGLLSQSNGTALSSEVSIAAGYAYKMADAMLEARKPDPNQ